MQVPVGVALDRFGSRRMILAGALTMAAGQFVLALATDVPTAVGARVLVGAGDAMTFISVLRVIRLWFPARRVPLITQLTGHPRAARLDRGRLSRWSPCCTARRGGPPSSARRRPACWSGSLVLVALRDAPPGRRGRRAAGRPARRGAASASPGGSPAPGSASSPTWSPSSPAPSSRCSGAIPSWSWGRGAPRRPPPACSPCWSSSAWASVRCWAGSAGLAAAPLGPGVRRSSPPTR